MTKLYCGDENNVSRRIKRCYYGDQNNIARKIAKVYCGDEHNIARLVFLAHVHSYNYRVSYSNTSTSSHTVVNYCKCGDYTTSTQRHSFDTPYDYKAPTCIEDGYSTYRCVCTATNKTTLNKSDEYHDYNVVTTQPTCVDTGYTTHTCSICADSYTDNKVPSLGHNLGEPTYDTTDGKYYKECSRCDYREEVSVHEHEFLQDGDGVHSNCSCGANYCDVMYNGRHSFVKDNYGAYGNCIECGVNYCDANNIEHEEIIDNAVEATCTEDGLTEGSHCWVCGKVLVAQTVVKATGHNYKSVVTEPDCDSSGYTTHTCNNCGDTYTTDIEDATGHNFLQDGDGVYFNCESCGANYCDVNHFGKHNFVKDNYGAYGNCTRCGVNYCDLNGLAHEEIIYNAVEATCTEDGLTEGKKCLVCGKVLVAQEEIPALGHNYKSVVTEATCTDNGYTTHTCTRCGDSYTNNHISSLGHEYISVVTQPTCSDKGYTTHTCSRCGHSYIDSYTDTVGHRYIGGVCEWCGDKAGGGSSGGENDQM